MQYWHQFHAPLLALGVALALALSGRFLRVSLLAAAAAGMGVLVGWYLITGALWVTTPRLSIDDLVQIAAVALVVGIGTTRTGPGTIAILGALAAALFAGWWLAGAPRHLAGLRANWPIALGTAAATLVFIRALATGALQPLNVAMAALTLAASLYLVAAPFVWLQLALVPSLAALVLFALPSMPAQAALPLAADIAAIDCLAVVTLGRLPHLGVSPIDVAAASPLLALWLVPRMAPRLGFAGQATPLAACLLSGGIAAAIAWASHGLFRH
jgi:hypothetical protein